MRRHFALPADLARVALFTLEIPTYASDISWEHLGTSLHVVGTSTHGGSTFCAWNPGGPYWHSMRLVPSISTRTNITLSLEAPGRSYDRRLGAYLAQNMIIVLYFTVTSLIR